MGVIWLYCLFGNEELLMPYFLRHYSEQVDRLIMLDGGSRDGSKAMIEVCPNAEIQASPFAEGGYDEYKFVDYLTEKCKEGRGAADWVLVMDADEFLYAPEGLRVALSRCRSQGMYAIRAIGYQMMAEAFPTGDGQMTDLVRTGTPDYEYDKLAAFDPELEVKWSPGRHNFKITNGYAHRAGLKLLHYRYFGEGYLRQRNIHNFARRSADDIAAGRGYHCAPDHVGKYSPDWFRLALSAARDVVS